MRETKWARARLALIVSMVTALVFSRTLIAGYLNWDDNVFILQNTLLGLPFVEFAKSVFSNYFFGDYLPVTLLSYWAEMRIFGQWPQAQHVINLAIHLANVSLLLLWLDRLPGAPFTRAQLALVGMAFAFHPLQCEPVMWIAERKSLLSIFFALVCLHATERAEKKGLSWRFLAAAAFALSILSKATAIALPVLLVLIAKIVRQKSWFASIREQAGLLIMALAFAGVRIVAYGQSVQGMSDFGYSPARLLLLPLQMSSALGFYLTKFFAPIGLSAIYPPFVLDAWTWLRASLAVAFVIFSWYGWRRARKLSKRSDAVSSRATSSWILVFGAWIVLFFLPVLHVVPRINFVNDRYAYLPIIGMVAIVVLTLPGLFRLRTTIAVVSIAWALVCFTRTDTWVNNETLWRDTVAKNPSSGLAHSNLGEEYLNLGRFDQAIEMLEKATQIGLADGTAHLAYHNLGVIWSSPNAPNHVDLNKAEQAYRKSLELSRGDGYFTLYNLALVHLRLGRTAEAERELGELERWAASSKDRQWDQVSQRARELRKKLSTQ